MTREKFRKKRIPKKKKKKSPIHIYRSINIRFSSPLQLSLCDSVPGANEVTCRISGYQEQRITVFTTAGVSNAGGISSYSGSPRSRVSMRENYTYIYIHVYRLGIDTSWFGTRRWLLARWKHARG